MTTEQWKVALLAAIAATLLLWAIGDCTGLNDDLRTAFQCEQSPFDEDSPFYYEAVYSNGICVELR